MIHLLRNFNNASNAMAENRTRVNCLEGNYANHYTTIAWSLWVSSFPCCRIFVNFRKLDHKLIYDSESACTMYSLLYLFPSKHSNYVGKLNFITCCQEWDLNPRLHWRPEHCNFSYWSKGYVLESGALDRSAILTTSKFPSFLCSTDLAFKLCYLIQEFLALGDLYLDNNE